MRRGDIWTVAGGKDYAGKPRPVVVVQDDSFDATDSINGAGVVADGRGRALATYPLFSSFNVDSQPNSPYQAEIIRRRVETLALSFAQWLPGQMGL